MLKGQLRLQLIELQAMFDRQKQYRFEAMGTGGYYYTEEQKEYAFDMIRDKGIRATARILKVPRRTLQRWCRSYGIWVKRCPSWVYSWAERRRKRRLFWELRGY